MLGVELPPPLVARISNTSTDVKRILGAAVLLVLWACGEADVGTDPQPPGDGPAPEAPTLEIVGGAGEGDTIQARLVTLEVAVTRGTVAQEGVVVEFSTGADLFQPHTVYLFHWRNTAVDTTDASGRASAVVEFGSVSGAGSVLVRVPSLNLSASADYTTLPGQPDSVLILPRDTAMYVGMTLQLSYSVSDRFGNPTDDVPTFSAGAGITVDGNGLVRAVSHTRTAVLATAATAVDSALFSVVPEGIIAAGINSPSIGRITHLVIFSLDGSRFDTLFTHPAPHESNWGPSWSPDGSGVVFTPDAQPYVVDTLGSVSRLIPETAMWEALWPEYSPDGQAVYFTGTLTNMGENNRLWRVTTNGTDLAPVPGFSTNDGIWLTASCSPDGSRIVLADPSAHLLSILTLASSTVVHYPLIAFTPRWSPTADLIVFAGSGLMGMYTVRSDGTELRELIPSTRPILRGLSWSPDGEWIIARSHPSLIVVNAETGLEIPIPFTTDLSEPSWRH
jgi:hypothetical protein